FCVPVFKVTNSDIIVVFGNLLVYFLAFDQRFLCSIKNRKRYANQPALETVCSVIILIVGSGSFHGCRINSEIETGQKFGFLSFEPCVLNIFLMFKLRQ